MRKLIIVASTLALAACAGEAEVTDEEAVAEEVAEVDAAAGSYSWESDEGEAVVGYLNEDGTSMVQVAGETVNEGTWERNEDGQVCVTSPDRETEELTENCMTFGEVGEDGAMDITDSEGETNTVMKVS